MVGFNDIFLKLTTFYEVFVSYLFLERGLLKNSKVIFEGCLFIIENSREEVFRWDRSWFSKGKKMKKS